MKKTRKNSKRRTNSIKKGNRKSNKKYDKKSNKNKSYKIGGTGIFLNQGQDPKTAFEYYINNSTFKLLNNGANGIAILAKLKTDPGIVSPYKSMDSETYGNPVNIIIIKLVLINILPDKFSFSAPSMPSINVSCTQLSNVVEELNIQTDIALKTMEYLDPICPSPVYFDENISVELLTIMASNIVPLDPRFALLQACINKMILLVTQNTITGVSAIAMEFAENYQPLYAVKSELRIFMTAYILIKLAIDTGYSHGDYHPANIMINTTKLNYFNGLTGAPLLIDYGWSSKIIPEDLKIIKMLYKNKQYTMILDKLLSIPRKDGLNLREYLEYYGYIKSTNPMANQIMDHLFISRDTAIQTVIQKFEREHATNSMYPLLPLSKSYRNKLYSGVDIHNEIIVPVFDFNPDKVRKIHQVFNWAHDIFFNSFSKVYTINQLTCFYIIFCYNFIYILNNWEIEHLELIVLISLLFIENFDITDNNKRLNIFKFIELMTYTKYRDENQMKEFITKMYQLFKNKKVDTKYAPIIAQYTFTRETLIALMFNPQIYSDPNSVLQELKNAEPEFIGPILPKPADEPYVFPGEEESLS